MKDIARQIQSLISTIEPQLSRMNHHEMGIKPDVSLCHKSYLPKKQNWPDASFLISIFTKALPFLYAPFKFNCYCYRRIHRPFKAKMGHTPQTSVVRYLIIGFFLMATHRST